MGESRKSKRVSWATDVNLCQVRLFLSEDSPSQVRIGTQDHLQAKPYRSTQTGGVLGPDDNLPPGFEGVQPANPWTAKLSQIPLTKWKCPLRLAVNIAWQVVAGEESKEIETQNQREMRVLEAIYPRPSAIPPNPSELPGIQEPATNNDRLTPMVPITPIEDEDGSVDSNPVILPPAHLATASSLGGSSSSAAAANPPPAGVEHDLLSAARAALAAAISNGGNINNQCSNSSNLIDQSLLIKILSDPKMIEHLMTSRTSGNSQNALPPDMQFVPNSTPFNPAARRDPPPPPPPIALGVGLRPGPPQPPGPFYPPRTVPEVGPGARPPVARDVNYYKNLIQQHGGERRESGLQGQQEHMKRPGREMKPKIMKPCIYFNSSKGCRNGADCLYQHDVSAGQSGKRAKLDGEITGL